MQYAEKAWSSLKQSLPSISDNLKLDSSTTTIMNTNTTSVIAGVSLIACVSLYVSYKRDQLAHKRDQERDELIHKRDQERDELIHKRDQERDELIHKREQERDELMREQMQLVYKLVDNVILNTQKKSEE